MSLRNLHKKLSKPKFDNLYAYGTGIYDGVDAVFLYWQESWLHINDDELFNLDESNEIAGYRVVNRRHAYTTVNKINDSKYLDEQCSYWDELEDSIPEKHAYPLFLNKKGTKVIMIAENLGLRWYKEDGEHKEGDKRFDYIHPGYDFIETIIVDGIAHDERDGWCFQVDCDEHPARQYDLVLTMEDAKKEAKRRLKLQIKPFEEAIKYIEQL